MRGSRAARILWSKLEDLACSQLLIACINLLNADMYHFHLAQPTSPLPLLQAGRQDFAHHTVNERLNVCHPHHFISLGVSGVIRTWPTNLA